MISRLSGCELVLSGYRFPQALIALIKVNCEETNNCCHIASPLLHCDKHPITLFKSLVKEKGLSIL
jgi:hypothetical protein